MAEGGVGRTSNDLIKGWPNYGSPKSTCERDPIAILSVTDAVTECHVLPVDYILPLKCLGAR